MINVSQLTTDIQEKLRDVDGTQYSSQIIQRYLYDGECQILDLKPDAVTVDANHACTQGLVQDIGGMVPRPMRFAALVRNGQNEFVHHTTRTEIEKFAAQAPQGAVKAYAFDPRHATKFYVYPIPSVGQSVLVRYTPYPTAYGATTTVGAEYRGPLIDYVMFRCLEDDQEGTPNISRAQIHRNAFLSYFGQATAEEIRVSPNNPETNS